MANFTVTGQVQVRPDKDPRVNYGLRWKITTADEPQNICETGMFEIAIQDGSLNYVYAGTLSLVDPEVSGGLDLSISRDLIIEVVRFPLHDNPVTYPVTNSTREDGTFLFEDIVDSQTITQNILIYDSEIMPLDVPLTPGGFDTGETRLSAYQGDGLIPLWRQTPTDTVDDDLRPWLPNRTNVRESGNWNVETTVALDTKGGWYDNFYWLEQMFLTENGFEEDKTSSEGYTQEFIKEWGASVASGTAAELNLARDGGYSIFYYTDAVSPENGNIADSQVYTAYLLIDRAAPSPPNDFGASNVNFDVNENILLASGAHIQVNFHNELASLRTEPLWHEIQWQHQIDGVNQQWVRQGDISNYSIYLEENRNHTVRSRVKDFMSNTTSWSNPEEAYSFFVKPHPPKNLYRELITSGIDVSPELVVNFTSPDRFISDDEGSSEYRFKRFEDGTQTISQGVTALADKYLPMKFTDVISGWSKDVTYTWEYVFIDQNGDATNPLLLGLGDEKGIEKQTSVSYEYSHNITVPVDQSARRRWPVAVEDFDLQKNVYAPKGTLVSKQYSVPNGVYKVSLTVNEVLPDISTFEWIKYSISVDGGETWHAINPEAKPYDEEIPSIYTVNSLLTPEQRAVSPWGAKAFIDLVYSPAKVQVRLEFNRRADSIYMSPQCLNYSLKVVERKSQFNLTSPEGYPKMIKYRQGSRDYEVT